LSLNYIFEKNIKILFIIITYKCGFSNIYFMKIKDNPIKTTFIILKTTQNVKIWKKVKENKK